MFVRSVFSMSMVMRMRGIPRAPMLTLGVPAA